MMTEANIVGASSEDRKAFCEKYGHYEGMLGSLHPEACPTCGEPYKEEQDRPEEQEAA